MPISLTTCLSNNSAILGKDYENLGKQVNGFLIGHKVMLSYTSKTGFKIEKLNIFQQILRKLGFYKSTHLNYIDRKISKLAKSLPCQTKPQNYIEKLTHWVSAQLYGPLPPKLSSEEFAIKTCHERINSLWAKKNVIALGNTRASEAKIIGFAEEHGDHSFRANTTRQINALYKEGDIILVEGTEARKGILTGRHQMTGNLKPGCIVRGWEPENFESLNGDFFKSSKNKYEELKKCLKDFKAFEKKVGKLSNKDESEIKNKIEDLKVKIKGLNKYYQSNSHMILHADKTLGYCFAKWKNNTLSENKQHGLLFYCVVVNILCELEKQQEKALYKNSTASDLAAIKKDAKQRNISLVKEIDSALKTGKKVFIVAGASHLVEYPAMESCQEVKNRLKQHKFTILTRKDMFKWRIAVENRDLAIQSN